MCCHISEVLAYFYVFNGFSNDFNALQAQQCLIDDFRKFKKISSLSATGQAGKKRKPARFPKE